jgi:hypothetical protein
MRRFELALLLALLPGCAMTIDQHNKVADWPQLKIIEHFVPNAEMREKCAPYVAWHSTPIACAEFWFGRGECHIWHSSDFPPSEYARQHEIWHCLGYGHPGDDSMQRMVEKWKGRS